MAAGWWTVLKTVPWSEVISAAPQVATGARRLWDTVNRKPGAVDPATGLSPEMAAQEDDIIGLLIARSEQNDAELNDLRNQMRSASELIANAEKRAAQMIEEAKVNAKAEADRIVTGAKAEIDQEAVRAKEQLREQVAALVITGAEQILRREINAQAHADILATIKQDL